MSTTYFTKAVLLLIFLNGCGCFAGPVNHDETQTAKRVKRDLLQFALMVNCATGRRWRDYYGYGCYCGWGRSGNAVDDTDRCCQVHIDCYDRISREGICGSGPKWELYYRSGCTGCDSSRNNNCERRVCECDGAAARCFGRSHYNPANKGRCN
ncbi:basic phospholipase A2 PA-9C-like [Porites lutea]|uniref:basic phospholipase A2 PA-9C-like n=1 Tax=Porites lutea TaxID=51062 RepID=UPI003CC57A08